MERLLKQFKITLQSYEPDEPAGHIIMATHYTSDQQGNIHFSNNIPGLLGHVASFANGEWATVTQEEYAQEDNHGLSEMRQE